MDINNRIIFLENKLVKLRFDWKTSSDSMKKNIEAQGKSINAEIEILKKVLWRRKNKDLQTRMDMLKG